MMALKLNGIPKHGKESDLLEYLKCLQKFFLFFFFLAIFTGDFCSTLKFLALGQGIVG